MPNHKRKRQTTPKHQRNSAPEEENRTKRRSTRTPKNLGDGIGSNAPDERNDHETTEVADRGVLETPITSNSTIIFDREDLVLPILPGSALMGGPPSCSPFDPSIHSADGGDNASISTSSTTINVHPSQPGTEIINMEKSCSSLDHNIDLNDESEKFPSSSCRILSLIAIITTCILYVGVCSLNQVHQVRVNLLKKAFQRDMNRTKAELNVMQADHKSSLATISHCKNEIQTLVEKNRSCEQALTSTNDQVEEGEKENAMLHDKLTALEERMSSLIGSEEDIRSLLNEAWNKGDELKIRLEEKMSSHQSCETSLSSLTRVHFNVEEELAKSSARILDLEVLSMQQDEEVEKLVKVIEADSKEKNNLKAGLMATKNAIKVLDEQLFRRDDNILAYEMQLEFLEENEDDHQEHIMDLQNWNQRLKERNEELQLNMYSQQREAVAALGAVASSATVRKAKQFEHLRIAVQAEKDQMALEAASALNYIATAAKKIYKKELV